MKLFLTSSPCCPYPQKDGGIRYGYSRENGFLEELARGWEPDCQCLMICSDPDDFSRNDKMKEEFRGFFEISGIPVSGLTMCDRRNQKDLGRLLEESRMVILAGGHVPTQNKFFREIGLKAQISGFKGTVMGISAGTMNCAHTVYAQPELSGESTDPGYQRFLKGLGLTHLQILPHYQEVKDRLLDGRRLYEDITFEDSYGHTFYALVDGSYVLVQDGHQVLRGEGYRIRDGAMKRICVKDSQVEL
ncbi:MAG: type 1 glutamine amidotransferase-like domain-containing protein [Hungatella sp.]|nr:type 1 glutamine amidotransferase-like domain-containing protein [Hungatella sp.]